MFDLRVAKRPIRVGLGNSSPNGLAQSFDGDCDSVQLGASQYCVDADARTVRFGAAPSTPPVARYRLVGPLAKPRGSLGDAIPNPEAALEVICRNNPSNNIVPCDPATGAALELPMTIRQWANLEPHRNFLIDGHTMERYNRNPDGDDFANETLEHLVRTDPSFDVPAQWFAAASYGLMQLIPEEFGLAVSEGVPEAQRQAIWDIYDPLRDSPVEKLFNPNTCVPLGAQVLVLANVTLEGRDYECAEQFTQCTWERLWRRRLCVFNTGGESGLAGECKYSADLFLLVERYTPVP